MSILPGSFSASVERITAAPVVRRVERDPGADEFNRKQQDAQDGKRSDQEEAEGEIPQDVIDVSSDYQAAHLSPPSPAVRQTASSLPAPPSVVERHINIEG